jgi:hypothetical protein
MVFYFIQGEKLSSASFPPASYRRLYGTPQLLPPLITELHRSFRAWGELGYRPGPIAAERIWFGTEGELAIAGKAAPSRLHQVGLAPDLAAWLVLLDKWMETFVVIARARSVWNTLELAAALPFMTPAFLPPSLVAQPPDNWTRVAQALAEAVLDRPLRGQSQDRHWPMNS